MIVVKNVLQNLGIKQALGNSNEAKLAEFLIAGRILNPGASRRALVEWAKDQAIAEVLNISNRFDEDNLYETLDWLSKNQERIEKSIFQFRTKQATIKNIFLYDVTSSYLEGTDNELAAYGYNRDKKKGKMQVVIGLMCDSEGYPVSVEVFKGNTSDPKTVVSQLDKLKKNFGVERVIFVGDRGMIKSAEIEKITSDELKWNFITAITKPQIEAMLVKGMFTPQLFDTDTAEIWDDDIRYVLRQNPYRLEEVRKSRRDRIRFMIAKIEGKNKYLRDHLQASVDIVLRDIKKMLKSRKLDKFMFCKVVERKVEYKIDRQELREVQKLDGCYVIKSDVPASVADKDTIHDRYKDLAMVETAFRTIKNGLLEIHPIFVRKESRTRGHVFTCMLSYLATKFIWNKTRKLPVTQKFIYETLSNIQYSNYHFGSEIIKKLPSALHPHQAQILEKLDVTLPATL